MIIKTLNRSEAQNAMKEWVLNYPSLPEVEGDYLKIRKDIQEFNQKVRSECPDSIAKKRLLHRCSHWNFVVRLFVACAGI